MDMDKDLINRYAPTISCTWMNDFHMYYIIKKLELFVFECGTNDP